MSLRRGWAGWLAAGLCAAVVVRGGLAQTDTVAQLIAELNTSQSNEVREESAERLARSRDPRAVAPLIGALGDKDVKVRQAASWSDLVLEERAVGPLAALLGDEDAEVRENAVRALRALDPKVTEKLLATAKDSGNANARAGAAEVLRGVDDAQVSNAPAAKSGVGMNAAPAGKQVESPETVGMLLAAIDDPSVKARRNVVMALRGMKDSRVTEALIHALGDRDSNVRVYAAQGLGERRDPEGLEAVVTALRDPNRGVRETAADELGAWQEHRAVHFLVVDAKDYHADIRLVAVRVLARMPGASSDPVIRPALMAALRDPDHGVRREAEQGLQNAMTPAAKNAPSSPAPAAAGGVKVRAEAVEIPLIEMKNDDLDVRRMAARELAEVDNPQVKKALEAAWQAHDVTVITGAARSYLKENDKTKDEELTQVLRQFGDEEMANDLLNSGDERLVKAVRVWGVRHDKRVTGPVDGRMMLMPIPPD